MQVSDFFKYQAQTTPHPLAMEIKYAKGSYIYDSDDNPHLDFVAGVSACTLGHSHPAVVNAVKEQLDKYLHVMVYGEYIQQPAVDLCKKMAELLPEPLDTTYLVNSGTEAIEGSIKLARRYTGRSEIIAAKNSYHGNTLGSLSLMDYQERKRPFLPLLPDIRHIAFNCEWCLEQITEKTAGVILETIQGGAGFIEPIEGYLSSVQKRCNEVGALLILDEIQPGIGRTGKMFGFENYNCKPDIVVTGKGLGGGLPIGAFTASHEMMKHLTDNPKLGHITTFGGNPVIASAAFATLTELTNSNLIAETLKKEKLIRDHLSHPLIKEIRGRGLMLAAITENAEITNEVILKCKEKGLILFWLLFESKAIRITPPLTISNEEIVKGCQIICSVLDSIHN
ncbi:aspartate aminotransferase family protein [Winogradskyella vincentii]|uniref:Aspartate aminotransferase family protein n=1 Tax=Winogradskyella vincentii TaxID=2877122 RepID=A0ABS7Y0R0_9FLAO|nr:aspartate aminotransferase family protein [Winogradskyella vincentii]MCA0153518.1 aspartate aminotransferase family protein [Winogradskyella vincentii]